MLQHPVAGHPSALGLHRGCRDAAMGEDAQASPALQCGGCAGRVVETAHPLTPLQPLQPQSVALGDRESLCPRGRPFGPVWPPVTHSRCGCKLGWWVQGRMVGARRDGGCEVSTGMRRDGEPGQRSAPGSAHLRVRLRSFLSAASHPPAQPWVMQRSLTGARLGPACPRASP